MDRHEKKEHPGFVPSMPIDESDEKDEDGIWNYHMSRLQIGLYFLNLEDAIKHGDGYRLLRCFKFALLFEYKHRHTKYAYLLLHFFVKFYVVLSEDEALRLLNNRFINYVGGVGNNIPLDLHMEHLNLMLKLLLKNSSGHLTEKTIQRNARSLHTLSAVMKAVNEDCNKKRPSGHHGGKDPESSVETIVKDLAAGKVFKHQPGRKGYKSFKNFKKDIIGSDYRDFFTWAKNTIKRWEGIYESPHHKGI